MLGASRKCNTSRCVNTFQECAESDKFPENRLFIAVIRLAVRDAVSSKDPFIVATARRWLLGGEDFLLICDLAGLDPVATRKSAADRINGAL